MPATNQCRSSEDLLADFSRSRSEESFRELITRHLPLVYSTALRVTNGDKHFAEDIAQVVFTDLAQKADRIPAGTVVAGWLHQHAWFTSAKAIRSERRRQVREQDSFMPVSSFDAQQTDPEHLRPILDEALTNLKPEERDVLVLRFFESADLRRVGETLGISEDAAQKRVTRALEKLRAVFSSRGVTITSGALGTFLASQSTAAPAGLAQVISAGILAPAAAASSAAIASFFTGTKAKLASAGALLVAVSVPVLWQGHLLSEVRKENQRLKNQATDLDRLRAENEAFRASAASPENFEKMKRDLAELYRLRGEVTLLRNQHRPVPAPASVGAEKADQTAEEHLSVMIQAQIAELTHARFAELLSAGFPSVADNRNFTLVLEKENADMILKLFQNSAGIDLLSAPRITTADGREGRISVTEDLLLPDGKTLPLGLTVETLPHILADKTSVTLNLKVIFSEFLGWENQSQTIPRFRTRSAEHRETLSPGQMLIMGRSVRPQEGEVDEPKLQIYCFQAPVINAQGLAVRARVEDD